MRRRRAKYIERFHRPQLWCLQYLNWTDSRNNLHPYCFSYAFSSTFPSTSFYDSGNDFTLDFTWWWKIAIFLSWSCKRILYRELGVWAFWKIWEEECSWKVSRLDGDFVLLGVWKGCKLTPLVAVGARYEQIFDENIRFLGNWMIWKWRMSITQICYQIETSFKPGSWGLNFCFEIFVLGAVAVRGKK